MPFFSDVRFRTAVSREIITQTIKLEQRIPRESSGGRSTLQKYLVKDGLARSINLHGFNLFK